MVLAHGFRHLFMRALTVTRKPWSGSVFDWPGANLGTMTSLETHIGLGHGSTIGVFCTKCQMMDDEYVLPVQFWALALGSGLEPLAYSGRSSYE